MMDQLVPIVSNIVKYPWFWFRKILVSIDGTGFYLAALISFFIITMIILPLRGGGISGGIGSDIASAIKYSHSSNNSKKGKGD